MSSRAVLGVVGAALVLASTAEAVESAPPFASAAIEEQLRAQVPLAAPLHDSEGRTRTLGELLGERPALLVLGYYRCTMLCGLLLEGTAASLRTLDGLDVPAYAVVSVSIDPRDDAASARSRQQGVLGRLGWTPDRWPFLTGSDADVRAIADAVGFRYRYDRASDQYAHAAAVVVLAPGGRVSSYLYGIGFPTTELVAALHAAEQGGVRSPLERVLLRCFHYLPALRHYAGGIAWFLRLGALATLAVLGIWLARLTGARGAR